MTVKFYCIIDPNTKTINTTFAKNVFELFPRVNLTVDNVLISDLDHKLKIIVIQEVTYIMNVFKIHYPSFGGPAPIYGPAIIYQYDDDGEDCDISLENLNYIHLNTEFP